MSEPVNVKILDREFTVGVEPGERESLMSAAQLLDARMREVRGSNRMAALDRVAVLTALNLAHELLQGQLRRLQGTAKLNALGHGLLKTRRSQHLIGQGADFGHHAALDQFQQLAVLVLGFAGHFQTLVPAQHFKKLLPGLLHQAVACFLKTCLSQLELSLCQAVMRLNFAPSPKRLLNEHGALSSTARRSGFSAEGWKS